MDMTWKTIMLAFDNPTNCLDLRFIPCPIIIHTTHYARRLIWGSVNEHFTAMVMRWQWWRWKACPYVRLKNARHEISLNVTLVLDLSTAITLQLLSVIICFIKCFIISNDYAITKFSFWPLYKKFEKCAWPFTFCPITKEWSIVWINCDLLFYSLRSKD